MTITKNHLYSKKDSMYIYKLNPDKKFRILQLYIETIEKWNKAAFNSVKKLADHFNIERTRPSKIKKAFDKLWHEFFPLSKIDYSFNIFSYRHKHTFHHFDISSSKFDNLTDFLTKFPRAWYDTFLAYSSQAWSPTDIPKSTFIYYKPIILQSLLIPYKQKSYKHKKEASRAKDFFNDLYKLFDFIINLDGKSLEDIPNIQKNFNLSMFYKRLSQAVEIKSWAILNLSIEKSHNKSNSLRIIKEITHTLKSIFWNHIKILFITDAWREYLNNYKLRWLFVSDLDSSWIAKFLKEYDCELLITRFKQDNWFIENKNKYIEIACLDNYQIQSMNSSQFQNTLQSYVDLNNFFLKASNKFVYRWIWLTPLDNLASRFWLDKAKQLLSSICVSYIDKFNKLNEPVSKLTLFEINSIIKPFIGFDTDDSLYFKKMWPKSRHNLKN